MAMELYIHIPFCVRKCRYCDFLSFSCKETEQEEYMRALFQEISYYGKLYKQEEIQSIYIGGGTPSLLKAEWIVKLMECVKEHFKLAEDVEISMECNPKTLTREKLLAYKSCGINRLSLGLQSANNKELEVLGRIHTFEDFLENFEQARKAGFSNINIDLMSALPNQTKEDFLKSLKKVVSLRPEHISCYNLIIEEGTPFYDLYEEDVERRNEGLETVNLPDEKTEYEIYHETWDYLEAKGYHRYEISNYAKPGYACRHNIGYWKRIPYLGLGLGASSLLNQVRYENERDLSSYIKQVQEQGYANRLSQTLSRKEQMEEFIFLGLRLTEGIKREEFKEAFQVEIEGIYGEKLKELIDKGLLFQKEGRISLTSKGEDISNYVMSEFL